MYKTTSFRQAAFLVVVLMTSAWSSAQQGSTDHYDEDVIKAFCGLDFSGKRLAPGGATELAKAELLTEPVWNPISEIIVIEGYSVQAGLAQNENATYMVEYRILGRLDSSLVFAKLQTSYANKPLIRSEHFSIVLTDTHFELNASGNPQAIKGTPQWRIKTAPAAPHVGLMAAIQYVRQATNRTKEPMIKARAQRTLAELEVLAQFQSMPIQAAGPSQQQPEDVLSQFTQMQMDGAGFVPGESSQLGIFLAHPAQWRQDKIGVARGYGVKRTAFAFNKAEAYVQYDTLGEIDLQLRFTSSGANGNAIRQNYKLIFDNDYSLAPSTGNGPYAKIGPSRWRIEDAGSEQWVSVTAAIKYVTQMRDSTRDPTIKANANQTLAVLAHYR